MSYIPLSEFRNAACILILLFGRILEDITVNKSKVLLLLLLLLLLLIIIIIIIIVIIIIKHEDRRMFLNERGRRISQESDDSSESAFLFQRLSMTIQRFNAVAIQATFAMHTPTEDDI